jgi:HSP20 family protein
MLMRTDPFRDLDRLTQQLFGTMARPAAMPMDAFRKGDTFYVKLDLPGISLDAIDLTVHATRPGLDGDVEPLVAERPAGAFTRQVFLGDTLDADHIDADYTAGVLTLAIPVHEAAKPRKVAITSQDAKQIGPA